MCGKLSVVLLLHVGLPAWRGHHLWLALRRHHLWLALRWHHLRVTLGSHHGLPNDHWLAIRVQHHRLLLHLLRIGRLTSWYHHRLAVVVLRLHLLLHGRGARIGGGLSVAPVNVALRSVKRVLVVRPACLGVCLSNLFVESTIATSLFNTCFLTSISRF